MDGKIRQIDITNNKSFIPNESSYSEIEFDIILSEEWPFSARPIYYGGDANCSISNSIMISKPNIPFWIDYVQYIKIEFNLNKIASHKDVFQSSGPIALGSLVRVNDNSINKIILLPCNYLQCCGLKLGSDFYLPETDISDMDLLNKIKIAQIIHGKLVWGPLIRLIKMMNSLNPLTQFIILYELGKTNFTIFFCIDKIYAIKCKYIIANKR